MNLVSLVFCQVCWCLIGSAMGFGGQMGEAQRNEVLMFMPRNVCSHGPFRARFSMSSPLSALCLYLFLAAPAPTGICGRGFMSHTHKGSGKGNSALTWSPSLTAQMLRSGQTLLPSQNRTSFSSMAPTGKGSLAWHMPRLPG